MAKRNIEAMRAAMQSIAKDASSARLGDKLPSDRRQALLISIGMAPDSSNAAEPLEVAEEDEDDEL